MNRVGAAVEEMAMATSHYAHKDGPGYAPAFRSGAGAAFRDDGTDFNPVAYRTDEEDEVLTDGIKVMMSLVDHADDTRQMGFNITEIRFKRPQQKDLGVTESMERIWYIHVVVSHDSKWIDLITAYHPDTDVWEPDFKTRKER